MFLFCVQLSPSSYHHRISSQQLSHIILHQAESAVLLAFSACQGKSFAFSATDRRGGQWAGLTKERGHDRGYPSRVKSAKSYWWFRLSILAVTIAEPQGNAPQNHLWLFTRDGPFLL
jgi:hypothetical protein